MVDWSIKLKIEYSDDTFEIETTQKQIALDLFHEFLDGLERVNKIDEKPVSNHKSMNDPDRGGYQPHPSYLHPNPPGFE